MSRQARKKSESGIYHVMLRGINKQQIFFDEEDYRRFLSIIKQCKKLSGFQLYAYCLMPNHVHLVLKEQQEELAIIMKRIGCRFVYWYNAKYQRVGHLFQDRFRSEPIETDEYLLCAIRYIHNNPVEGKIVKKCSEYPYSSYACYLEENSIVDKEFPLSLIINIDEFRKFHNKKERERLFIDIQEEKLPITDKAAIEIILETAKIERISDFSKMSREEQNICIVKLKKSGISTRQIIRLTGASQYQVDRAKE